MLRPGRRRAAGTGLGQNLNLDVLLAAFFKVWPSTTVLGAGANVL